MKTIAQQLKVTKFPFTIKDDNGNEIYYEDSNGYWSKYEYDSNGKVIYFENSNGFWYKCEYYSNGNQIYVEDSNGYWSKYEYDSNRNRIYYENSRGYVSDNRPKKVEITLDEIANKFSIDVKNLKIKK